MEFLYTSAVTACHCASSALNIVRQGQVNDLQFSCHVIQRPPPLHDIMLVCAPAVPASQGQPDQSYLTPAQPDLAGSSPDPRAACDPCSIQPCKEIQLQACSTGHTLVPSADNPRHAHLSHFCARQDHKGNQLLELRSNAGTHDLAMGRQVLERLLNAGEGEEVRDPAVQLTAGSALPPCCLPREHHAWYGGEALCAGDRVVCDGKHMGSHRHSLHALMAGHLP